MTDSGTILFFSDAHFGAHEPAQEREKERRFETFLEHASRIHAEVYFLGDLFDFWFEYHHWMPKVSMRVLASIHRFTQSGGELHMLLGNHDIWAATYFSDQLGAHVHREDITIARQGLRIGISHGDGQARSDRGYRVLKQILRFGPNIALYRLLPADWAYALARFFSGRSRQLTASRPPKFLLEYDCVARDQIEGGCSAVIMGHIHQAWVKRLGEGWSVNTGEFFEKFNYVELVDGEFHLRSWNPNPQPTALP